MSQSDDLIAAGDALTGEVTDAYVNGAYAGFGDQLETLHNTLTSQMWLVRKYVVQINSAPPSKVQAAVAACSKASDAFQSAGTGNERGKAVALAGTAAATITPLLPAEARALV